MNLMTYPANGGAFGAVKHGAFIVKKSLLAPCDVFLEDLNKILRFG